MSHVAGDDPNKWAHRISRETSVGSSQKKMVRRYQTDNEELELTCPRPLSLERKRRDLHQAVDKSEVEEEE